MNHRPVAVEELQPVLPSRTLTRRIRRRFGVFGVADRLGVAALYDSLRPHFWYTRNPLNGSESTKSSLKSKNPKRLSYHWLNRPRGRNSDPSP